jgi:GNAT superfamily N-acetyltransferase
MPDWTLHQATDADTADTVHFVDTARRGLFALLADSPLPKDLARFSETYVDGQGCFLIARAQGRVIGGVGYLPYDHRFPQLDYHACRTVEIVRLFVTPDHRRHGLASALFSALREEARQAGVECLYLHTHPFLPGAIRFWQRHGFGTVDIEADPVWQTTHMALRLA